MFKEALAHLLKHKDLKAPSLKEGVSLDKIKSEGRTSEKNVPAKQKAPTEDTRLQSENEHSQWTQSLEEPSKKRAEETDRMRFPKSRRLLNRRDFRSVVTKGRRFIAKNIIIDYRFKNQPLSRLGIAASKRFGKSHQRNRFKRITREAFRNSITRFPPGLDIIVRPRKKALEASSCQIQEEMLSFLHDCLNSESESRTAKSG